MTLLMAARPVSRRLCDALRVDRLRRDTPLANKPREEKSTAPLPGARKGLEKRSHDDDERAFGKPPGMLSLLTADGIHLIDQILGVAKSGRLCSS